MKFSLYVLILLSVNTVVSQIENSTPLTNKHFYMYDSIIRKNSLLNPYLTNIKYLKSENYFTIYNKFSSLNDNYLLNNNILTFSNSRKNLKNDYRVYKIDAFNPYGTSNFKSSVIMGSLGILLKKIQK